MELSHGNLSEFFFVNVQPCSRSWLLLGTTWPRPWILFHRVRSRPWPLFHRVRSRPWPLFRRVGSRPGPVFRRVRSRPWPVMSWPRNTTAWRWLIRRLMWLMQLTGWRRWSLWPRCTSVSCVSTARPLRLSGLWPMTSWPIRVSNSHTVSEMPTFENLNS